MIDKYLSNKLRLISLFSIVMVVFLHSYNLGEEILKNRETKKNVVFLIEYFISQGITRVAVPIFFAISGYLLFLNKEQTFSNYKLMLKKRFKSLVIPYLFWSVLLFLFFFVLQILPQLANFFKQKRIINYTFMEIMNTIFINPIPFQLWFIRDLFIFVIFSPIIYLIIKSINYIFLFILLVFWYLQLDFVVFSNEALLFFVLGSYLAIKNVNLKNDLISQKSIYLIILWISIVLLESILVFNNFSNENYLIIIHKSSIILGICAIWFFYDLHFNEKEKTEQKYLYFSQMSFFTYLFHEPLLDIVKIVYYKVFGINEFLMLLLYVSSPVFVIFLCILIGQYLKKRTPIFFQIINGGR